MGRILWSVPTERRNSTIPTLTHSFNHDCSLENWSQYPNNPPRHLQVGSQSKKHHHHHLQNWTWYPNNLCRHKTNRLTSPLLWPRNTLGPPTTQGPRSLLQGPVIHSRGHLCHLHMHPQNPRSLQNARKAMLQLPKKGPQRAGAPQEARHVKGRGTEW